MEQFVDFEDAWRLYLFKRRLFFTSLFFFVTNGQVVDSDSKENVEQDEVAHDEQDEEVEHEGAAKAGYSSVRLRWKKPNILCVNSSQ